jgi:hypothetical protein
MGFMRLAPQNSIATRVAGARTFVYGGAAIFLTGVVGVLLAAIGLFAFAWEQAALMIIGATVAAVGLVIPRNRPDR